MSVNSNGYIHLGGNIRNIYILLLLSLAYSQPNNFSYNSTSWQAFYLFEFVYIDNTLITAEDWVGAFNGDVCVGARQCGSGICDVPLMGDDGMAHSEGYMQNGDIPSFKIYDYSENVYYNAIPSEDIPWGNLAFNIIDSLTVFRDCNGVLGGMAYEDDCGLCDSNPTNDCFYECDLGDVNCDGELNVLDVVLMVNMILTDEYDEIADINEDGVLNVLDVVRLVNLILDNIPNDTVTDIDGNVYETIQIGEQLWMAENLKVTHYNNGDSISYPSDEDFGSFNEGQYGVYDNDYTNADIYGNLYNWFAVDDDRGVCPEGWHVPSDEGWTILTDFIAPEGIESWGNSIAGGKMKETGLDHWNSPNTGAANESGFTGLPAGYRNYDTGYYFYMGSYDYVGDYGYFWSSSENFGGNAWVRLLSYDTSSVGRGYSSKEFGLSIRCLGD